MKSIFPGPGPTSPPLLSQAPPSPLLLVLLLHTFPPTTHTHTAPLHADVLLSKLSQSEDPKIKANCARTLKNMTSDSTEVRMFIRILLRMFFKIFFTHFLIVCKIPLHIYLPYVCDACSVSMCTHHFVGPEHLMLSTTHKH